MQREALLERVKQTIHEVGAETDIILYGSRARGDAQAESDWDFRIWLDGVANDARTDTIRHRLYEIEWDYGEVLCSMVRSRQEWNSPLHQPTPFSQMVQAQGIPIRPHRIEKPSKSGPYKSMLYVVRRLHICPTELSIPGHPSTL